MPPAHHTKHLPLLELSFRSHTFTLAQTDDGTANGTALWLSGQILSAFLVSHVPPPPKSARPRAIELGSGIGLTALVLASLGWHVTATDAHPAVLSLLSQNIQRNISDLPGSVQVCKLDWCVPPKEWSLPPDTEPFDLILTADTFYTPRLTPDLLRTLRYLACPETGPPVQTYIALERRESDVIDAALSGLPQPTRIPHRKLIKAMQSVGWGDWDADDWAGVEVWKVRWGDKGRPSSEQE